MIIKPSANGSNGWLAGLAILLIGLALGALLDPSDWFARAPTSSKQAAPGAPLELAAFLKPNPKPAAPADNGLETLHVSFEQQEAETLQRVRNDAMARGIIIQAEEDTIKGAVSLEGKSVKAELRIKGDWIDHVNTDKWSLRIKLKQDKLNGMSVFSIQHPRTRGMLWEWLALAAARREGLLAPRSGFVNVVLNGNPLGVYYLEEHFSKELLESQERREGPIVLWDESARWATLLQVHNVYPKKVLLHVPNGDRRTMDLNSAEVRAYGEKRLSSIESLSRSMFSAVQQMQDLQSLTIAGMGIESPLRRMRAIEDVRGRTIDRLVDTDKLAQMHALLGLFQIWHALSWHNMRFYHDPVLDRLEPILFDCNAHKPSGRDIPMFRVRANLMREFGSSQTYYNGVFEHLAHFTAPGYLEGLQDELGPELRRFEAALEAELGLESAFTVEGMFQRLRNEQAFLRTVIDPVDAINVHASHNLVAPESGAPISGELRVDAWITTRTPVEVRGFEFSNGSIVSALSAVLEDAGFLQATPAGGVILPSDGSPLSFRFSSDERLAGLEHVKLLLELAREDEPSNALLDLDIKLLYRPLAVRELRSQALNFRHVDPVWISEGGRPEPPSLQEALAQHSFLEFHHELGQLWVKPGEWQVQGDLLVPAGFGLHAANAKLFFDQDAALISSSPLHFKEVSLAPQADFDRWRGVVVLQAKGRSRWEQVSVRATDAIARGGWIVTGGITFYRSPIDMLDCHIDGTWAEDGTNIFGTDFSMERVRFSACASDSFDGDFVTGTLKNCLFEEGLADGVDVSGSRVRVENCRFLNMGDKAISAGENSEVHVEGGLCRNVSIGIAAKDRSRVTVRGMTIEGARNYALTAFIKKPEFGAAQLSASGLRISVSGLGDYLVQTGCSLELDGQLQPTQDLDVKRLYLDKILGQ